MHLGVTRRFASAAALLPNHAERQICTTRSGPNRPAAAIEGMIFWDFLALWLVVLVFLAIETR